MGKQAIIMTAYNDFELLCWSISKMQKVFDVYIHIDKKATVPSKFIEMVKQYDNVWVISKLSINWGSYKHILAICDLLELARSHHKYDFYHIISENTIGINEYSEIYDFFSENLDKNYIEVKVIEELPEKVYLQNCINEYYFLHHANMRATNGLQILNRKIWTFLHFLLKVIRKKKVLKFDYLWKGYLYCHLNKEFVEYMFLNKDKILSPMLNEIKYFYVGEEFFFQCIIMNSPFSDTVINNSLIFDIWSEERGYPAFLNVEDINEIKMSGKQFMRKVSSENSIELLKKYGITDFYYEKDETNLKYKDL